MDRIASLDEQIAKKRERLHRRDQRARPAVRLAARDVVATLYTLLDSVTA